MIYFSIKELCHSDTATRLKIKNEPNETERANLVRLIDNVLDPCREKYGEPIKVTSGFRSKALNSKIGGVKGSQHQDGQAADIVSLYQGKAGNLTIGRLIIQFCDFDQLIFEEVNGTSMLPQWIHVSYRSKEKNRHQVLKKVQKGGYKSVDVKKELGL